MRALAVLDVSPFARGCAGDGGCIFPVGGPAGRAERPLDGPPLAAAPPLTAALPPAAAPPGTSSTAGPARTALLEKLRRVTGEPAIPPSDDVRTAAAGRPIAVAIVKLCLAPDGKVDTTKIVKSSGVPAYDQLQTTIKATWAFEPVDHGGASPRCRCCRREPHAVACARRDRRQARAGVHVRNLPDPLTTV